ncbi:hypothetical protein RCL1_001354 [Eukaryota sp. TZLM3-RCL]
MEVLGSSLTHIITSYQQNSAFRQFFYNSIPKAVRSCTDNVSKLNLYSLLNSCNVIFPSPHIETALLYLKRHIPDTEFTSSSIDSQESSSWLTLFHKMFTTYLTNQRKDDVDRLISVLKECVVASSSRSTDTFDSIFVVASLYKETVYLVREAEIKLTLITKVLNFLNFKPQIIPQPVGYRCFISILTRQRNNLSSLIKTVKCFKPLVATIDEPAIEVGFHYEFETCEVEQVATDHDIEYFFGTSDFVGDLESIGIDEVQDALEFDFC